MIKLSEKGEESQLRLLDSFKSQMQEIANEAVNEAYKLATFKIESQDYKMLKDKIIQELKGKWIKLNFFTQEELDDVLLLIARDKKDLLEKSVIDNYENRIKQLQKEIEGYYPF